MIEISNSWQTIYTILDNKSQFLKKKIPNSRQKNQILAKRITQVLHKQYNSCLKLLPKITQLLLKKYPSFITYSEKLTRIERNLLKFFLYCLNLLSFLIIPKIL